MSNVTACRHHPPRVPRPPAWLETFLAEAERPGDIHGAPMAADRSEKANAVEHTTCTSYGESDSSIVPEKSANKGSVPLPAESREGRGLTKENTEQSLLDRTQSRKSNGRPFVARSRGLLGVRETVRFACQHPR